MLPLLADPLLYAAGAAIPMGGGGAGASPPKTGMGGTPAVNPQHVVPAKAMIPTVLSRPGDQQKIAEVHGHIEQQPQLAAWLAHHAVGSYDHAAGEHGVISGNATRALHHLLRESAHYPHLLDLFRNHEMTPEDLPGQVERHEENIDRIRNIPVPDARKFLGGIYPPGKEPLRELPIGAPAKDYEPEPGQHLYFTGPGGEHLNTGRFKQFENTPQGRKARIVLNQPHDAQDTAAYDLGYKRGAGPWGDIEDTHLDPQGGRHELIVSHTADAADAQATLDRWHELNDEAQKAGIVGPSVMFGNDVQNRLAHLRALDSMRDDHARLYRIGRRDAEQMRPRGTGATALPGLEKGEGKRLEQWRDELSEGSGHPESEPVYHLIKERLKANGHNDLAGMNMHLVPGRTARHGAGSYMAGYVHPLADPLSAQVYDLWQQHLKADPTARHADLKKIVDHVVDTEYPAGADSLDEVRRYMESGPRMEHPQHIQEATADPAARAVITRSRDLQRYEAERSGIRRIANLTALPQELWDLADARRHDPEAYRRQLQMIGPESATFLRDHLAISGAFNTRQLAGHLAREISRRQDALESAPPAVHRLAQQIEGGDEKGAVAAAPHVFRGDPDGYQAMHAWTEQHWPEAFTLADLPAIHSREGAALLAAKQLVAIRKHMPPPGARAPRSETGTPLAYAAGEPAGLGTPPGGGAAAPAPVKAPPFHSRLGNALQGLGNKPLPAQAVYNRVKKAGVADEEWHAANMPAALAGKAQVTPQELQQHFGAQQVLPGEHWNTESKYADTGKGVRYSQYQTPGGKNYRELLLTVPQSAASKDASSLRAEIEDRQMRLNNDIDESNASTDDYDPAEEFETERREIAALREQLRGHEREANDYRSPHWDEPNVIAHARMNDRTLPGGEKALHVEEIQSDLHQAGRQQGYKPDAEQVSKASHEFNDAVNELKAKYGIKSGRELQTAVSLSRERWRKMGGEGALLSKDETERIVNAEHRYDQMLKAQSSGVPDLPYKDSWPTLALKRLLYHAAENGHDRLTLNSGKQIKGLVGGEEGGQSEFYDKILPNVLAKLGKPYGVRPERRPLVETPEVVQNALDVVMPLYQEHMLGPKQPGDEVTAQTIRDVFDHPLRMGNRDFIKLMEQRLGHDDTWWLRDELQKLNDTPVTSLRLTPEMRRSILATGFPHMEEGGVAPGGPTVLQPGEVVQPGGGRPWQVPLVPGADPNRDSVVAPLGAGDLVRPVRRDPADRLARLGEVVLYAAVAPPPSPRPVYPDVARKGPADPQHAGAFAPAGEGIIHPGLAKPKLGGMPQPVGLATHRPPGQQVGSLLPAQPQEPAPMAQPPAIQPDTGPPTLDDMIQGGQEYHALSGGFPWQQAGTGHHARMLDHLRQMPPGRFWDLVHRLHQAQAAQEQQQAPVEAPLAYARAAAPLAYAAGEAPPPESKPVAAGPAVRPPNIGTPQGAANVHLPAAQKVVRRAMQTRPRGPEVALGEGNRHLAHLAETGALPEEFTNLPRVQGLPGGFYAPAGMDPAGVLQAHGVEAPVRPVREADLHPPTPTPEAEAAPAAAPTPAAPPFPTQQQFHKLLKKAKPVGDTETGWNDTRTLTHRGTKYFAKLPTNLHEAGNEVAASKIQELLGIPDAQRVQALPGPKGERYLVSPGLPGEGIPSIAARIDKTPIGKGGEKLSTEEAARMVRAAQPGHLAAKGFAHWLLNSADRHASNNLYHEGGVNPIDHGVAFYPLSYSETDNWGGKDYLFHGLKPEEIAGLPLDRGLVKKTLANRDAIEDTIRQDVLPHRSTRGNYSREAVLKHYDAKFAKLAAALQKDGPLTLGDLGIDGRVSLPTLPKHAAS